MRVTAARRGVVSGHRSADCIFLIGRAGIRTSDGNAGDSASMPQLPLSRTSCSRLPVTKPSYKKNCKPTTIMPGDNPTPGRLYIRIFMERLEIALF